MAAFLENICRALELAGDRDAAAELRRRAAAGSAEAVLLDLLGHSSRRVVRLACDALIRLGGGDALDQDLAERLGADDREHRWAAAFVLIERGVRGSRALETVVIETLASDDRDTRWAAAQAACDLAGRDPRFVDRLRLAARAAGATARKMVLHCLRRSATGSESDFVAYLRDEDVAVRLAALAGLAAAPACSEAAIAAVADRLSCDQDIGVRCTAAFTLGRVGRGSDSARTALVRAREADRDPRLRRVAAESLRRLGGDGRL